VIVDAGGTVRHASSVTPDGKRNIEELADLCVRVDGESGLSLEDIPPPPGLPPDAVLFVKSHCGFSRAALLARDNLHLQERLPVRNVSEDAAALDGLREAGGKEQAPCLVVEGRPVYESQEIIRYLVNATTDVPG
jgi:hypothetical protein